MRRAARSGAARAAGLPAISDRSSTRRVRTRRTSSRRVASEGGLGVLHDGRPPGVIGAVHPALLRDVPDQVLRPADDVVLGDHPVVRAVLVGLLAPAERRLVTRTGIVVVE